MLLPKSADGAPMRKSLIKSADNTSGNNDSMAVHEFISHDIDGVVHSRELGQTTSLDLEKTRLIGITKVPVTESTK